MATTPRIEIVRPKGPITGFSRAKVVGRMRQLGLATVRSAAVYPSQQTSYRRTGELGRRWTMRGPSLQGKDLVVETGSNLKYAARVMGLKSGGEQSQLDLFRRLGWRSIEDIGNEGVDKAKPSIVKALQGK